MFFQIKWNPKVSFCEEAAEWFMKDDGQASEDGSEDCRCMKLLQKPVYVDTCQTDSTLAM